MKQFRRGIAGISAIALAMLVAGAALLVAGCGSSGSGSTGASQLDTGVEFNPPADSSASEPSAAKLTLIKEGDEICERTDREQVAGQKQYLKKHPKAEATRAGKEEALIAAGFPPLRTEGEDLSHLRPPGGEEETLSAIVEALVEGVAAAEHEPGRVLGYGSNPFSEAERLAADYGFEACAKPA
jgi:hypothetical protein